MWKIFATPCVNSEEKMNPTALLLHLCPAYNALEGVRRAFAVVAKSCERNTRIQPDQVLTLLHPYGPLPDKNIAQAWDTEAIESMIRDAGSAKATKQQGVNYDQLLFMKCTQPIASHLKDWYQLKDPYIQARNSAVEEM